MTRFGKFIQQNPLGVSSAAFLIGFVAFGNCFDLLARLRLRQSLGRDMTILCAVSLGLCIVALVNLVRAQGRGYPTQRGQMSAVILFFAFVGPVLLTVQMIRYYLRT